MLLQSRRDRTRIGMRCLCLVGIVREQPRNSQQLHRGKMQAIKPPTVRLSRDPLLTQGYPASLKSIKLFKVIERYAERPSARQPPSRSTKTVSHGAQWSSPSPRCARTDLLQIAHCHREARSWLPDRALPPRGHCEARSWPPAQVRRRCWAAPQSAPSGSIAPPRCTNDSDRQNERIRIEK